MPDNSSAGALEDFLIGLAPPGDALLTHARQCVGNLPTDLRRFAEAHRSKAEIRTWLAWQEEPGLPFGTALKAGYLDISHARVGEFVQWLNALFNTGPAGDAVSNSPTQNGPPLPRTSVPGDRAS